MESKKLHPAVEGINLYEEAPVVRAANGVLQSMLAGTSVEWEAFDTSETHVEVTMRGLGATVILSLDLEATPDDLVVTIAIAIARLAGAEIDVEETWALNSRALPSDLRNT